MKRLTYSQQAFFTLTRAGLWADIKVKGSPLAFPESVNWDEVDRLAEEQSVLGLIAAGIDQANEGNVPLDNVLQFVGSALQIERQNTAMNKFIAKLIEKLRYSDIYALLLKGQSIAQCYERPLWRAPGDVDLLLSDENYARADILLSPMATSIDDEITYAKHKALIIDGWTIELHGSLRCGLWNRMDRVLDKIQYDFFAGAMYVRG